MAFIAVCLAFALGTVLGAIAAAIGLGYLWLVDTW